MNLTVGGFYNWRNQPERLVYLGRKGVWHQFAKTDDPKTVWCEVLLEDLSMLEQVVLEHLQETPDDRS